MDKVVRRLRVRSENYLTIAELSDSTDRVF
jgi:hypothetical protein